MAMQLEPDFAEFLKLLRTHGVEYLLIGGFAVGIHGYPRATSDIDIWIERNQQTARKMLAVLADFGFAASGASEQLFLDEQQIVRLGEVPVRIEISNSISGVVFEECYPRRVTTVLDGVDVDVISRDDLLINKAAAGRPRDVNDLKRLVRGKRRRIK